MASDVERIKEKLPIEEVVGSYVKLERSGGRLKGRCPFHNEKTPSFFVSPDRGTYYCFGCGAKGDIFTFIQEFEHLDFPGALKTLASRAGIELSNTFSKENRSEKEALYEVLERATLFFQRELALRKDVQKYLTDRGLSIATIKSWRLGFAPDDAHALSNALKEKGHSQNVIAKAGLSKPSDRNPGEEYDRFRNRVVFPLFDGSGRVVGFSGRIFGEENEKSGPKYLNSPETEIFHKSSFLYGFDRAKLEIRKQETAILVEGQMDLLMSHQVGVTNAVAVSGTAFTEEHVELLRRFAKTLTLAFDADAAGDRAGLRALGLALAKGLEVKICVIDGGKDPADLAKNNPDAWKNAVNKSVHVIEYVLAKAMKIEDKKVRHRIIEDNVVPYIAALESTTEQSHFKNMLEIQSGISLKDLEKIITAVSVEDKTILSEKKMGRERESRLDMIERRVAAFLAWPKAPKEIREKIGSIDALLLKRLDEDAKERTDELIYEAEAWFANADHIDRDIDELLANLEEEYLKNRLAQALLELKRAEAAEDRDAIGGLLKTCQDISLRLHALKKQL